MECVLKVRVCGMVADTASNHAVFFAFSRCMLHAPGARLSYPQNRPAEPRPEQPETEPCTRRLLDVSVGLRQHDYTLSTDTVYMQGTVFRRT